MTTAAEHFAWAKARALEYVELGDHGSAHASFVSDLGKHPGTEGLLTAAFQEAFMDAAIDGGAAGVRRFIEGLVPELEESTQ